jgi:hypothetical protein
MTAAKLTPAALDELEKLEAAAKSGDWTFVYDIALRKHAPELIRLARIGLEAEMHERSRQYWCSCAEPRPNPKHVLRGYRSPACLVCGSWIGSRCDAVKP